MKKEIEKEEQKPNIVIRCRECGGGLRKSEYRNEFETKKLVKIVCVVCKKEYE